MKSFLQGKWLGHPLHPFLVHVPVGLWPTAFVFDVISNLGNSSPVLVRLSFCALALGLTSAVLAIGPGLADWSDIPRTNPAWKIGLVHLTLNLVITLLVVVNIGTRLNSWQTATAVESGSLVLSLIAAVLLLVSGYLGARMVYHYGIGVTRYPTDNWKQVARADGASVSIE